MQTHTTKVDIEQKQEPLVTLDEIIIKDGAFNFKDVSYDKINAQNFKGNFDFNKNILNLKNITSQIAQGEILAHGNYDFKTTKLNLAGTMKDCASNILAQQFLNMKDQINGKINGQVTLSAKHLNTPDGIKNVKSDVVFSVDNGKMPKLGSLEYFLMAGNLVKNGILGLSLNNLIQVLTPYKTGEFEVITGALKINNAKVENLEIKSKGKNLSLYLVGNYDILKTYADINIYGKLSQNVSNALGRIGNASIKHFIDSIANIKDNKREARLQKNLDEIPDIDDKKPRFFSVEVLGDINKENYIKNFKWE